MYSGDYIERSAWIETWTGAIISRLTGSGLFQLFFEVTAKNEAAS
jgi:hypothetical protein